jgi:hypothetical protein
MRKETHNLKSLDLQESFQRQERLKDTKFKRLILSNQEFKERAEMQSFQQLLVKKA